LKDVDARTIKTKGNTMRRTGTSTLRPTNAKRAVCIAYFTTEPGGDSS
jgi:hypothetical protein